MYGISARIIAMIVGVLAIGGLIFFGVTQCQSRKIADKQAEVSREQGQASIGAGAEAVNTVGNINDSDRATDETVAAGQQAIRNAPEGQKGHATKAAVCRLKSYANTPQCKEPQP